MSSNESLKDKYAPYFKIGTAINPFDIDDPKKAELIKTHFNSITCANSMKYVSLTNAPGMYNFAGADKLVKFAKENNIAMHGHTFVWHNQVPDYIFENATADSLLGYLKGHAMIFKEHFGELETIDAVNEAIEDKSDAYLRNTKWLNIIGEDYLAKVFHILHDVFPNTELFYNDYNECFPNKREKIVRMLKGLIADGVPISGMGMQTHVRIYWPEFDEMKRSIEEYASLGLKLRISELDVSMYKGAEDPELVPDKELLKKQADYYEELFKIYRNYHEHIEAVTFWGFADSDSWLNNFPVRGRKDYPLLFDDNSEMKEAFYRIMDF